MNSTMLLTRNVDLSIHDAKKSNLVCFAIDVVTRNGEVFFCDRVSGKFFELVKQSLWLQLHLFPIRMVFLLQD